MLTSLTRIVESPPTHGYQKDTLLRKSGTVVDATTARGRRGAARAIRTWGPAKVALASNAMPN